MQDVTLVGYTRVQIPTINTFVTYQDTMYVVHSTVTHQDQSGAFATSVTLLEIDDEGYETGKEPITVESAHISII